MMVSPGCRCAVRSSRIASTAATGTIRQMVRGAVSLATRSATDVAPTMPACSRSGTRSWLLPTQVCPARSSRRTMLPPIRPSPIIPNCIVASPYPPVSIPVPAGSCRPDAVRRFPAALLDHLGQARQPRRDVRAEVHAQRAPAAVGENLEVAPRLGGLDDPEGVFLPRHRQIVRIITRDLQEHA